MVDQTARVIKIRNPLVGGFTLIELIITIALIAILATFIVANIYQGSSQQARDSRRISDMQAIQKALEQCFGLSGQYPTVLTFASPLSCSGETILNPVPKDPKDPNATPYLAPTLTATDYCVCAYLEKKSPNSNDRNCTFTGVTPPAWGGGYFCVKNQQ